MTENFTDQLTRIDQAIATIKELDSPNFTDTTITMLRQKATKLRVEHEKSRRAKLVGNILIDLHRVHGMASSVEESERQVEAIGHALEWLIGNQMFADPTLGQTVLDADEIAMVNALLEDILLSNNTLDSASMVRGLFDGIHDTITRAQNIKEV